jgi:RNA polymerase sigma-70 factor (ECF subfamily)
MEPDDSFAALEARLRAGDQGAATEVFQRFKDRLIGLARTQLDTRLRRKEDPEDVVQSVYRSFFTRHKDGEFDLGDWNSLWSLLTVITVRKCLSRARYYGTQGRNLASEVDAETRDRDASGLNEAIDREPTPLEAAVLTETVEQVMLRLQPDERSIFALSLQGYSAPEISSRLGRAERTVRRVRDHIKKRLQRMQVDGSHAA